MLATSNAVIPYAVGVDISCSMNLRVTDIPVSSLRGEKDRLIKVLESETRFGLGASFGKPRDHAVFESASWEALPVIQHQKDRAYRQLGSSGGGNHFVE